jgi:sugar lactone lactonase YvrE
MTSNLAVWLGTIYFLIIRFVAGSPTSQVALPLKDHYKPYNFGLQSSEATSQLVERCGPSTVDVVCINHYTSVLPGDFFRAPINNSNRPADQPSYSQTSGINETNSSFDLISSASFILWEPVRALSLLGKHPTHEFIVQLPEAFHEAPVYVPETNELYFSQMSLDVLAQPVIHLNDSPPTLSYKVASPPIYSAQGGIYHKGLIYFTTGGGNASYEARPGIVTLNATTGKSEVLLNNYFGWYLNSPDDIAIDSNGDIWFTDNSYSYGNGVNTRAPVLPIQTYRFRPSTGLLTVVEDTLEQPNGICFSPDGQTLYLSDTGPLAGEVNQQKPPGVSNYQLLNHRTIYAFDVIEKTAGKPYLANKRPIYMTQNWLPDGLKASREGYILTGTGTSVDVLDAEGELLMSIPTNFTAVNINWAGKDLEELWIVGVGGVSRVTGLNLHGQTLT